MMVCLLVLFFFNEPATPEIYTLSLHDALPISTLMRRTPIAAKSKTECPNAALFKKFTGFGATALHTASICSWRSEEHTSELQSRVDLVCRLLLEKKNQAITRFTRLPTR